MDALSSLGSNKQIDHPSPADFDKYLPWACSQLSVEANIIITRSVMKEYVSMTNADTDRIKLKRKKSRPTSSSATIQSSFDKTASVFARSVMEHEKNISVETFYDGNLNLVRLKFIKNNAIPRQVMKIIGLIIQFHKHLTSITINSGLHMDAIYEISKFLPISRVTELCLDGTYLIEANYHILLDQNSLKHLSLAKCKINDTVLKTITSKLVYQYPASKTLSVLNLATNRITDTGVKYLAEMLRSNRQLSYLNLADNMITDIGASSIFDSLIEFSLTSTELVDEKIRQVKYMRKRNLLAQTIANSLQTGDIDKKVTKKKNKPSGPALQRRKTIEKDKSFDNTTSQPNMEASLYEAAKAMAESKIGSFNDPFGPNNVKKRGDVTYCFGNNSLCYLNLAYNNLTYTSIKRLYEVLVSQKILNRTPKGLVNVVIEGNYLPVTCGEFEEIDALLTSGLEAFNAAPDTLKKRASRSRTNTK